MTKRMEDLGERCPVRTAIAVLHGKWKPAIVYYLRAGTKRYSEMRRLIPASTPQVLTQHLRELEEDGIVTRTIYPVVPPKVEYALTALGRQLGPILDLLEGWGGEVLTRHDQREQQSPQKPQHEPRERLPAQRQQQAPQPPRQPRRGA